MDFRFEDLVNPLTPVSDQGRFPPYIIDQTGGEIIKKNMRLGMSQLMQYQNS